MNQAYLAITTRRIGVEHIPPHTQKSIHTWGSSASAATAAASAAAAAADCCR